MVSVSDFFLKTKVRILKPCNKCVKLNQALVEANKYSLSETLVT